MRPPRLPWRAGVPLLHSSRKASYLRALPFRPYSTSKKVTKTQLQSQLQPQPQPVRLRDYQEECIQSVLSSLQHGHKRLGISLATGAGKTVVFTQLIDRIKPVDKHAKKTLILAHRRELVEQAARHCSNAYPDKTVDIEMGKLHASGMADITVASIQSIDSGDRISKFDPSQFKLVLVDEAHHIVAPGYLRTLEHFGLDQKRDKSPILVGVSATFSRFDGLRLGKAIDELVYHKDYIDMIGDKWLSDVVFTTVQSTADIRRVRSAANGDFQSGELSQAVNTQEVNEVTIRSWLAKAQGRKSTLVFCVDIAHVMGLTQAFRDHGIDARFVTGDTHKVERSECLTAFKRGEFPVLVNCGVFTEGTDIPNIDCVVLARPTRSRNLIVQMIGRGMRLHPSKTNCHVIDMVSSLETGIITAPTLFGLDPSEIVENATIDDMRKIKDQKNAEDEMSESAEVPKSTGPTTQPSRPGAITGQVTFTEYDTVFDLLSDTSGESHIHAISRYSWVRVAERKYILSAPGGTYIRLQAEGDENDGGSEPRFSAWEIRPLPQGISSKSPFAAPRQLLKATTFTDAVHGCDKYASEKFPPGFINRRARWRKNPATAGQLKFLNKLRRPEAELSPADINMGKAADMITKLKHGARGRFSALNVDRRKKQRQAATLEQLEARKLREIVSVGSLAA